MKGRFQGIRDRGPETNLKSLMAISTGRNAGGQNVVDTVGLERKDGLILGGRDKTG